MSAIRGKGTKPEMIVRRCLTSLGVRYRLHRKDIAGCPDIAMPGKKIAIFVHGCFWHAHAGCKHSNVPKSNIDFWQAKLARNVERDQSYLLWLSAAGWRVLVVWECAMRGKPNMSVLCERIAKWLAGGSSFEELGRVERIVEGKCR